MQKELEGVVPAHATVSDDGTAPDQSTAISNVGSSATVALVTEPGKPPRFTLVPRPGNIPNTSSLARPPNTTTVTELECTFDTAQSGNVPKVSFVPQSGNISRITQRGFTSITAQPGNAPRVSVVPQPGNTSIVTQRGCNLATAQPGNVPRVSYVPQPGNTLTVTQPACTSATAQPRINPKASLVAPHEIPPKFALITQCGQRPILTVVNHSNNQEPSLKAEPEGTPVSQAGTSSSLSAVAALLHPERLPVPQLGVIPAAAPGATAGIARVIPPSTQCVSVLSASTGAPLASFPTIAHPANIRPFTSVAQAGSLPEACQAAPGSLPASYPTPTIDQRNLAKTFVRPFTGKVSPRGQGKRKRTLIRVTGGCERSCGVLQYVTTFWTVMSLRFHFHAVVSVGQFHLDAQLIALKVYYKT